MQACPPSAGYRLRKFARRNKRALATACVVALAVMLASGIGGWALWDRAARQAMIAGRVDQLLDDSATLHGQRKLPEATQIARDALALAEGGAGDPGGRAAPATGSRTWTWSPGSRRSTPAATATGN